jgi:hypothetical protein
VPRQGIEHREAALFNKRLNRVATYQQQSASIKVPPPRLGRWLRSKWIG